MEYGYKGKILTIDLFTHRMDNWQPERTFYRRYVGGRALGLYYLLKELRAGVDPLSAENILIFATSPTVGAPFPGNARHSVVAKSPLTLGFGESEAGGFWGPELKKAGCDAVVIKGKAAHPTYVLIEEGDVSLADAREVWGKTIPECLEIFRAKHKEAQVLCIGPAGEHLVRYAGISAGAHNMNGRMGLGAVMGSKNLKALVVNGTEPVRVYEPERLKEVAKWFAENFLNDPTNRLLNEAGTAGAVEIYDELGSLPSYNFKYGTIKHANKISGYTWKSEGQMVGARSCFACPVACRKVAKFRNPFAKDDRVVTSHLAEYESIAALGSNCGITEGSAVLALSARCDELGLDTISTGDVLAFIMECEEKGLLKDQKWKELKDLTFGNAAKAYELIGKIAYREGIGDLLAEGVRRIANEVGPAAAAFAMHVKGEEIALQEPRGQKIGAALGYAVAPQGGDHIQMEHDFQFAAPSPFLESVEPFGIVEPIPAMDLGPEKVRLFVFNQALWSLYNVFDLCLFVAPPGHTYRLNHLLEIIHAVTGWNTSWAELLDIGKRALTMARCYNLREGLDASDDWLPERFFEPLQGGSSSGNNIPKDALRKAIQTYYALMGWDPKTGIPTAATLHYFGLSWLLNDAEIQELLAHQEGESSR